MPIDGFCKHKLILLLFLHIGSEGWTGTSGSELQIWDCCHCGSVIGFYRSCFSSLTWITLYCCYNSSHLATGHSTVLNSHPVRKLYLIVWTLSSLCLCCEVLCGIFCAIIRMNVCYIICSWHVRVGVHAFMHMHIVLVSLFHTPLFRIWIVVL